MANSLEILNDKEIRLECIRLAVEFAPEIVRHDPLFKAQEYYNWVLNQKNSKRQSVRTAKIPDKL
jgi:hypothetical protein|tara:strand:+ start:4366 stop:4560 length:195 start_codon:yes stop_codon:yes gene_type:complete